MSENKPLQTRDELKARIRSAGLRCTASRVAVLQALMGASGPLSHADVADRLTTSDIDRATIYRNLIDMTEAGLLSRADLGDHVWRFVVRKDVPHQERDHPHFVCTDCGVVSCLPEAVETFQDQAITHHRVIGTVSEVVIKGQCHACAEAEIEPGQEGA